MALQVTNSALCIVFFFFWLSLSLSWFSEEVREVKKRLCATVKIFLSTTDLDKIFLLFRLLQVTISDNVHLNKEYSHSYLLFSSCIWRAWMRHVHQRDPVGQEQYNYFSFFILFRELPWSRVCQIGLSMAIAFIPEESQTWRRHPDGPHQCPNYITGECLYIYTSFTPDNSRSKGKCDKPWNFSS